MIKTRSMVQIFVIAAIEIVSEWLFGVNAFRFPGNLEAPLFPTPEKPCF